MAEQPEWGRASRRQRREIARQLAKEYMRQGDTKEKKGKILTYLGLALAFGSWGYFVLAPELNPILGFLLILAAFAFFEAAFWDLSSWTKRTKTLIAGCALLVFVTADYRGVRYLTRPSFVFVSPIAIANDNEWDFMINHRGPKPSRPGELLFTDKDKMDDVIRTHSQLTPQNFASYQEMFSLPEINPHGRGHVFATQFLWKPFNFEHEHYLVTISEGDRATYEDLEIEKVKDKWVEAITVREKETGHVLLNCRDPGFPYGDPSPLRCFPEFHSSGD